MYLEKASIHLHIKLSMHYNASLSLQNDAQMTFYYLNCPSPLKKRLNLYYIHTYIMSSAFFAELISCFHDDFFFFPSLLTCSLSQWSEIISFMEYFCNSVCTCIFTRHFSIALFISNKGDVYLPLVTYLSNHFVKKNRRN